MFATTLDTEEPVRRALAWIAARGIDVRPWPHPDGHPPAGASRAVLHVVQADAEPPRCGEREDWIREPLDRDELYARADLLLARAQRHGPVSVEVDDDGILRVDDRIVILSPTEADVLRVLVSHLDRIVDRADLVRAVWGRADAEVRLLAKHVAALRRRLDGLPLELHAVRGRGLLLVRSVRS